MSVPIPALTQDGLADGMFAVGAQLVVDGQAYPWFTIDVTLALYGVASVIEAGVPMVVPDKVGQPIERDFCAEVQQKRLLPLAVSVSYGDGAADSAPLQLLETGFSDEFNDTREANEITIVGRSSASLFQDVFITAQAYFSRTGSDVVEDIAHEQGFVTGPAPAPGVTFVIVPSPSGSGFRGRPGYTEEQFLRSHRARSMWDEMRDAALADGYILTMHNGIGYYGPRPSNVPTIGLQWGRDLIACEVKHVGRRAHDVVVRFDGSDKNGNPLSAAYGTGGFSSGGSSVQAEANQLVYWGGDNTTRDKLKADAYARWLDVVLHEFTAELTLAPDPAFMTMLCQYGAGFNVVLSGIKPSQAILYFVRQAKITIAADGDEPSCLVKLTCSNIEPQAGEGGFDGSA